MSGTGGFPLHLRDLYTQDGELTRCGLFARDLGSRMSDDPWWCRCIDCLAEGPAAAWVILPGGIVIERRSRALEECPFGVAYARSTTSGPRWRLRHWAASLREARTLADRFPVRLRTQIVPVLFAGVTYNNLKEERR
jgi:hypothetical protein